jgi:large subunit ribosomal protein L10
MLTRKEKDQIIDFLSQKVKERPYIYFASFKGLKTKDLNELKNELLKERSEATIAKKTLLDLAFRKNDLDGFKETYNFDGTLLTVFAGLDPIKTAKILWQFSLKKANNFNLLGGLVEGQFINALLLVNIAKTPTKEVLLGRLVGALESPLYNFIWLIKSPLSSLAYALKAIQNKK